MDNVTHTLFALTLARTPLGRAGRGTTATLVLASNAPDLDVVATAHGARSYLTWHRGETLAVRGAASAVSPAGDHRDHRRHVSPAHGPSDVLWRPCSQPV